MANRNKTGLLVGVFVAAVAVVAVLTVVLSGAFLNQPAQPTNGCSSGHKNYKVIIQNSKVNPDHTTAHHCDTLTIVNKDNIERLIAFGPHEHHVAYDGVTERPLDKDQSLTVTLVQTGNFRFHDHAHDEVQGTFTVEK